MSSRNPSVPTKRADPTVPADSKIESETAPQAGLGILVLAGLIIICAGLKTVSSIVAPLFLVLTLVITVQPLRTILTRRRVPRPLASVIVLLSVYALLVIVLGSVVWSLTRLVQVLPDYAAKFTDLYNQALGLLAQYGIATSTITKAASSVNLSSFTGVLQTVLNGVTSGLSLLVLMLALVFFLVFDGADIGERILVIRDSRSHIADALADFSNSVRKYWIVTTVFGLIVAVIDVVGLLIVGVPLAVTWGVLAFVTNYIPNVGFVLGIIPPALIALLDGGVGSMVAVIIIYTASNVIIQTLVQPRFTGDAVGITGTVAFLSLIFWAFLLGALGALLAVPATLLVKSLLVDHSASSRWLGSLLNAKPPKIEQRPLPWRRKAPGATAVVTSKR